MLEKIVFSKLELNKIYYVGYLMATLKKIKLYAILV